MSEGEFEDFGQQIADAAEAFLLGLQAISREEEPGSAVPLLLLEVSQLLLAGARLGAQQDFQPETEYQPDVGPDADLDAMRLRLADKLGDADTYSHNFEPYDPETFTSNLSDDLTLIATDIANGLRHFRAGNVEEALWWWQYSYLASWGSQACGVVAALHSVVAHDRLDLDVDETDQLEAADAVLDGELL
ncbi:DUF5063 domain-containing protein [Nocardioides marmoriginsengisoli]|uniref:DUF5063 domain-containing protein n=1 Tax=Nocardioides marmoriginsengisoli TaxID=661483 RepID=A0A3N0CFE1_9ACTN|nr:DUF5063 domain-containing protein [Nocardioides marmoriginsengisoli]RNL62158.1 DUF5063 domain-containing protein [Nocardioides marmoriginsengisoli]